MAANLNIATSLTPQQKSVRDTIIAYGQQHQYTQEMIATAILIANGESDFKPTLPPNKYGASGLFQHKPDAWLIGYREFAANHPNDPLLTQPHVSPETSSVELQSAVFFSALEQYSVEWFNGTYQGQTKTVQSIGELRGHGYIVDSFPEYTYLRHNGTANETAGVVFGERVAVDTKTWMGANTYPNPFATNMSAALVLAGGSPSTVQVSSVHLPVVAVLNSGAGTYVFGSGSTVALTGQFDRIEGNGSEFLITRADAQGTPTSKVWFSTATGVYVNCGVGADIGIKFWNPTGQTFAWVYRAGNTCSINPDGSLLLSPTGIKPITIFSSGAFTGPSKPSGDGVIPNLKKADGSDFFQYQLEGDATAVAIDYESQSVVQSLAPQGDKDRVAVTAFGNTIIYDVEPGAIDGRQVSAVESINGAAVTDESVASVFNSTGVLAGLNGEVGVASDVLGLLKVLIGNYASTSSNQQSGSVANDFGLSTTTTFSPTTTHPAGEISISADNSTLISTGSVLVTGFGNVNTDSGAGAAINYFISNTFRPGDISVVSGLGSSAYAEYQSFASSTLFQQVNVDSFAALLNTTIPTDPLVLDLNGDGVKLTDYTSAPVLFDADHDGGSLEQTGWVSAQDGIVVYDLNGNGKIDDISETLSEYFNGAVGTGGSAGTKPYANGLAALKSLDSNSDGQFTSLDAAWSNVKVWVDANHDGKTDTGELRTFASLGVTSIALTSTTQSGLVRDGNEVLATSTFVMGGIAREAVAAGFLTNPAGHTITSVGSGSNNLVTTEGGVVNGVTVAQSKTYAAQNAAGETIDVATIVSGGVNNAYGSTGNDSLTGDANGNWLVGNGGSDTFNAGAGDDVLLIDALDLQANIHGGAGNDIAQVVGDIGVTLNLSQAEVEIAQGGRGDDVLIGGGRSSVFIGGGDGNDILIGGAANDALSGENGNDIADGGAGNDIVRGHRGQDQLFGGAGDDLIEGGQDDDVLNGGSGNDVLNGGQGDDNIDGGDGQDALQLTGSYADYRLIQLNDGWLVKDTVAGRDGNDFVKNVEAVSFKDLSNVALGSLTSPLPVKDVLAADSVGAAFTRVATARTISKSQILGNDIDWQGDVLHIAAITDVQGGTATINAGGDVVFTPNATFTGIMGFKYQVADAANHQTQITDIATGQTAPMKGTVWLKTADVPTDPLATDEWYLSDANILPVWKDYTGKGVRIGQFEPGGNFSTTKEVLDYRHPDLAPNIAVESVQ